MVQTGQETALQTELETELETELVMVQTVLERQGEMETGAQGGEVADDEGGCAWRRGGGGR